MNDHALNEAIARLQRAHLDLVVEIKALKVYFALRRYAQAKANFNPSQPRVPRGSANGGQWTDAGASPAPSAHARLIPARAAAPIQGRVFAGVHWTAERLRDAWNRADAWAEQFVPGGLDTALQVPSEFTRLMFRFGGEESLRAYDRASQKFSDDLARVYHDEVNRAVSQGRMTRRQADDTTVIVVAAASIGARGRLAKRPRISAKPKALADWQKSETHMASVVDATSRQTSFKYRKTVPYGTPGSVRPDLCVGDMCTFEIKNYDVNKNIEGLIYTTGKQARERRVHLPKKVTQNVAIDITGQRVTVEQKAKIKSGIENNSAERFARTTSSFLEGIGDEHRLVWRRPNL